MKRIAFASLMVCALVLLVMQGASAQNGSTGCTWGNSYDPLLTGYVPACLNGFPAASEAAAKPAGLAALAPAVDPKQGLPCLPWGDVHDPATMMLRYGPECVNRPADSAAAPKTAGLAKLAPVESFVPCGFSEQLDPLLDPLALVCLSQPVSAAKTASKPAGLAAPAQERSVDCDTGESFRKAFVAALSLPTLDAACR